MYFLPVLTQICNVLVAGEVLFCGLPVPEMAKSKCSGALNFGIIIQQIVHLPLICSLFIGLVIKQLLPLTPDECSPDIQAE